MDRVIITGITGFLGSQIAEKLIEEGVTVIGLKRLTSDLWRCRAFIDKVEWVDLVDGYQEALIKKKPNGLIHSAWMGVEATDRDNWLMQAQNVKFLIELLEIAKQVKLKKIIFLGSQAEYGMINGKTSETSVPISTTAYGCIKLACLQILKTFSELNDLQWIWLRIFSLFGERENDNWLIPSIIKKMQGGSEMDFTKGDQRYAYLYIKDFMEIVSRVFHMDINSGIYNVSGLEVRTLRSIITTIRDLVKPEFKLNFGAIPYRPHQSMHIEGDMTKLTSQIGQVNFTNFNVALEHTINSYLNQSKSL